MTGARQQELVALARAWAAQPGLDEKLAAARDLQRLVLACPPAAVERALKENRFDIEYVRAVLTAARPGLTAAAPSAEDASLLAATRLAVYKAGLALLSAQAEAAQHGATGGSQDSQAQGRAAGAAAAAAAAAAALTERQAGELVSVLDMELGGITGAGDLFEVAETAVEAFESDAPLGCAALDLLPKALALMQAAGGEVSMRSEQSGDVACQVSDVCKGFLDRVCSHSWPLPSIGRVLASLRAFPLTRESLAGVVKTAVKRARLADGQDLPAVVHQLLMLSARGGRELILGEVMRLFEAREAAAADSSAHQQRQLLEVQGSVLLHLDMAVKHDGELGQAWLRQLRSDAPPRLSAFALAVSFMLAGTQRFEQPVTDALKSLVLGAYKDAAAQAACPWLPPPSSRLAAASGAGRAAALRNALLLCARNSGHGQGGIVQPMAALAVALIEAGGAAAAGKGSAVVAAAAAAAAEAGPQIGGGGVEGADGGASWATPAQRAADLGTRLLLELYEAHRDFRREIICLCHNRLVGAREEVAAPYVRLLALLVRRNQATIGDHLGEMKLSLEHLAFLPPAAGLALLLAVWPVCWARRDAHDYVAMLLRKAMFSRELHARLLAARGFLYMITQELQGGGGGGGGGFGASEPGPSQVPLSQLGSLSGGGGGGATLLHEAMSFLRRCLAQQPEVRRAVYDGMPALLAADPSVQAARGGGDEGGATGMLRSRFAALRRRLAESTVEDFNLDKSSQDYCASTPDGQLGQALADAVLGCLEAAMEDYVEELTGGANDGFKLPEQTQTQSQATMAASVKLCRDQGFVTAVLTAALRRLHACEAGDLTAAIAAGTAGSEADAAAVRRLFAVPDWQQLSRPLFRAVQTVVLSHCKSRAAGGAAGAGAKKEKDPTEAMTQAAARALQQLLAMGAAGGLAGLAAVLEQLPPPSAGAVAAANLPPADGLSASQRAVAAALPLLHEMLQAALKPSCSKELELLCGGLVLLAGLLPPAFAGAVAGWAVEGLEGLSGLTQAAAAKALLQLALRGLAAAARPAAGPAAGEAGGGTGGGTGGDLGLLLAVATDVREMMNAEELGEEGERFAALNARTHLGMLAVAGAHLEAALGNLEWALGKLRSLGAAACDASQPVAARQRLEATRQAWERAGLLRQRQLAEVLVVLCDVRLEGTACEALVKSLTRLYKLLGAAAKAQTPPKGAGGGSGAAVSGAFSDLAHWVNRDCTPLEVHGQNQPEGEQQENDGGDNEEDERRAKKRARAGAAAASRVPNLIFQIEEFERHLIRLSKAGTPRTAMRSRAGCLPRLVAGGANLMVTARRATNRDFKIKLGSEGREEGEAGGAVPRGKRRRVYHEHQEQEMEEGLEGEEEEEGEGEEGEEA
ncbi:hypothetical protein CHLNCDRAFT_144181 [Chlorella variabilis]|uniref:Uncharacterized protein n=1 Tax=Chlorella variabilis TaxID=554065 RepID=E1ZC36_CHLVA|nr:hypothetical protein CHLNCDRAFT_144181 [Chlorella variabilis]EFN56539.1 hypothetical protein CHLNCDRAFT_144181 [Chlorella variabilis]|eukprot:XP_005848641.1 hypothetical protein CHLNCDRAFT_144181 [Chlorella variabilis]